jgi:spore maturation protein CgeB
MRVLFFQWYSFMNKGIEKALKKLNIEYSVFFWQFNDWETDEIFLQKFKKELEKENFTVVLSVNYAPLVSEICEQKNVRYLAWIYDSPLHIRDLSSLKNKCNYLFFFDRGQAEEYKKIGTNAMHMPLAVDTEIFGKTIKPDRKRYQTDVSMVGKLYQTEYADYIGCLSEYTKGYLEGIINSQSKIYGGYLIPELITQELLDRINKDYKEKKIDFKMGYRELEFMLACETTGRERYTALALLSNHFKVDLYSTDEEKDLPNVMFKGYADYYTQMPQIFYGSKVNLNISLKTIRTGIPLRVIDIMGCDGFVITNYQEEIAEYFKIDEECVVYDNLEDLYEKTRYYLEHDSVRAKIADAGYQRVSRDFTFEDRLQRMFQKIK